MTTFKSMSKVAVAAFILFGINGLINLALMKPIEGGSEVFNHFRRHMDDAVFILLFVFIALIFLAMFAVLPQERGYLYLGTISFLTSLQLFWDWDDKVLLFGPFPENPYGSLAIKSGMTLLIFFFVAYLLRTANKPITRVLLWAGGMLWATILAVLLIAVNDSWLNVLNRLFLIHVFLNMSLCISQFLALLRRKEHQVEFRWIASGL